MLNNSLTSGAKQISLFHNGNRGRFNSVDNGAGVEIKRRNDGAHCACRNLLAHGRCGGNGEIVVSQFISTIATCEIALR